ncbi:MAG TPA: ABC-F family ATP-binding cassette domain-containing protein [Acidimicrobiales bacterium]|nr:ABC-F family ATP-binding cassette domain-containing protein [Acidimicrobiales bacterium]
MVLSEVSLAVGPDTRLGVVGPNGVGKTTLLRVLAGLEEPDSGTVSLSPPEATVGYLPQERERRPDEPVLAYLRRRTGVEDAEAAMEAAAAAMAAGRPGADERYAGALERWGSLGGGDLDARAASILTDLGLPAAVLERPTSVLSGGESARVALAATLLSRFDLTLLDEPTNDLDFAGLARLEEFVGSLTGGVVLVSHDRAFLERTITSVLEIDEHTHGATLYAGGWAAYLEERATARRHAEEAYADYQVRRGQLVDRADRERRWATSGVGREKKAPKDNDKAQRGFRIDRTERLAARARRTERAMERLEPVDKPWEGWRLSYSIARAPRSGAVVARLDGAVVDRGGFRLGPVDLEVAWADRLLVSGPNGSGKTTLIGALLGRVPLSSGARYMGPGVVVGEMGQDRASLGRGPSLLDAFIARTGQTVPEARTLLAKFGLGADEVLRPAGSLSPGERTRAELALFQAIGVNFLVLDEPTNHLDMPAIEQLEEALAGYEGTLLLVSHDRRLLEAVETTTEIRLGAAQAPAVSPDADRSPRHT